MSLPGAPLDKRTIASITVLLNLILVVGVAQAGNAIGVNYGRLGSNLPPPARVVQIIKNLQIGSARIFDHDPTVISAFANSGIELVIGVTNQEVVGIGQSSATASQWVQQYVVPYYPATQISTITVANEPLSYYGEQDVAIWYQLNPAMLNLYSALKTVGLHRNIKLTTVLAYDVLNISYPPTNGSFRSDVAIPIVQPLLKFLSSTGAPFMVNVYPYFAFASNPNVSLDYSTFGIQAVPVSDGSYKYTNILDAQLDALHFAMTRLGYPNISICISETGWPTKGDENQPGTSIVNAAHYNRRLVRKVIAAKGTPAMPGVFVPTFIFGLFNEDQKPGPTTERNWGLLYPDGSPVYSIDLTGQLADSGYSPLGGEGSATAPPPSPGAGAGAAPPPQSSVPPPFPAPQNSPPVPYVPSVPPPPPVPSTVVPPPPAPLSPPPPSPVVPTTPPQPPAAPAAGTVQWCMANPGATPQAIQAALDYACGAGQADCVSIQPGHQCFDPNTLQNHASWALNSYWQQTKALGGSCDFQGAAVLSSVNPSLGGCIYPGN